MVVAIAVASGCGTTVNKQTTRSVAQRETTTSTQQATGTSGTQPPAQTATTPTPSRPSINGCLYPGRHTRLIHFHAPGERLLAAIVGAGPIGVVLANQTDNTVCEWMPFPAFLAAHRMRVLAFDYGNGDDSAEVQAAARYLRDHGARSLVLIGASIGGAVVIDAGVHLHPPPAAVISLSAVPEVTNYPFPKDAKRLTSPIFHIASTEDQITNYARDTRTLFHASPSPAKRLLLLSGVAHGTDFVGSGGSKQIRNAILAFIRAHT